MCLPQVARTLRILCLLPALALASPVQAQYFGRNKIQYEAFDFQQLRTEHFDIYFYESERAMAEQAARMAERWYARLARALDMELRGRQPLILYANHPDFEQTTAIPGEIDESTGGVTESFKRRIVLPLAGTLAETDHVIGHEIVHAFQFDLRRQADRNPFDPGAQLPLWFLEGMAEYLSVGPADPHTAMWIRDAALANRLPAIRKLNDPRFFPYRYGQALWSWIAARHGEASVGRMMRAAMTKGMTLEQAFENALGVPMDSLSAEWHRDVLAWAEPAGSLEKDGPGGRTVRAARKGVASLHLAPSLSPDGTRFAFLSERDLVSIELYLADTRTGKVLRRLTRASVDPHLQSLQFIHSAGGWSPDGRRFAIATVNGGKPALTVLDVETGRTLQRIPFPGLGEIFHPTWSPDGRRIAFSALTGGATDLFLVDLPGGAVERLTTDLHADLHPAWSPDGSRLAFATDRFETRLDELRYAPPRLAVLDLASREIRPVAGGDAGKNINPQWTPDGSSLFFISDRQGISNLFRVELGDGKVSQVTDVRAGVSGITRLSPALSVARKGGDVLFSVYGGDGYSLRAIDAGDSALGGFAPRGAIAGTGFLPPAAPERLEPVTAVRDTTLLPDTTRFETRPYRSGLSLDFVSQTSIGVAAGSGGVGIGGGSAFYWSDMLGYHNLATMLQLSSSQGGLSRNLGALAGYSNMRQRWNWGVQAYQIPYFSRYFESEGTVVGGRSAVIERDVRAWQIERAVEGALYYPLHRAQRFEMALGYRNIDFDGEVRSITYDQADGFIFSDVTGPGSIDSLRSLHLFTSSIAAVYDNSIFGGTSPVDGQRYRIEFAPIVGDLQFATVLADYRRYLKVAGPLGFAGRLMHVGRYGRDSESDRIGELYVGQPWLIRGYDASSFTFEECDGAECPEFDRLFGSRIGLANAELRLPLIGGLGMIRTAGVPPIELAGFFDTGVAWTDDEPARVFGGRRSAVSSYGSAIRLNLLGFAVAEIAYVHPNDRPRKGWYWQFQLQPGF